jgi:hypothetical protein
MISKLKILLDFTNIAENVRNLVLKADYVALGENHLDVLLIEFL